MRNFILIGDVHKIDLVTMDCKFVCTLK